MAITIKAFKNYKIHTFTSPEETGLDNTHIIETHNKLIIIDAQFLLPHAKEVREYVNQLNKPIECLVISHSHPDHWFGSEYFSDVKIYALKEVKEEIEQIGDLIINNYQFMNGNAPLVPTKKIVPSHILEEGRFVVDELEMVVTKVLETEGSVISMIEIPEDGILIAQDLVYSNCHIFMAQGESERVNWRKTLEALKNKNYKVIFGGHGEPASEKVFDEVIAYVEYAGECLVKLTNDNISNKEKAEKYKKHLKEKYPNLKAESLIDITTGYLFR